MVFKFLKFRRSKTCCALELILSWGSTITGAAKEGSIFKGDRSKSDQYLHAVDEIQLWTESATILDNQIKANTVIQIAMARLESEFQNILISLTTPITTCKHGPKRPLSNYFSTLSLPMTTNLEAYPRSSTYSSSRTTDPRSSTFSSSVTYSTNLYQKTRITDSTTGFEDYNYVEFSTKFKQSIDDLRSIAVRMNFAGHLPKCIEVYQNARKLRKMDWKALEEKGRQWIRAAKICVTNLFASEKKLSEQIFGGLGTHSDDECFVEVVKDHAIQLFKSGEAISICLGAPSRRPQKFKILDLHDQFSKILPDLDVVFQLKSLECIRTRAAGNGMLPLALCLLRLKEVFYRNFENSVLLEQSSSQDQRGRINTLTTYVMAYVTRISSYKETQTELIITKQSKKEDMRNSGDLTIPDMTLDELEGRTPLVVHLICIIEILQFKLEDKSKCYKDTSLAQFFLMNNVQYIAQKVQEHPKLGDMIGNDYLEKLTENVRLLMAGYLKSTWGRVTYCLREEGLKATQSLFSGVSKSPLKERLKTFNATFEEVQQTQARWVVPNIQLRKKLRLSILEELIPAYISCVKLFKNHIGSEDHLEKFIRYSVEDLNTAVSNFFVGIVEVQI
ncbi:exocyst complex component EXO70A1-like [Cornus florida]|uniref:exocyst complex component EXO70A1-like n=1 Tax=Cornus florida TaxID=4283 RepID=UPI0028997B93|nr:exocyst complex component EXO70A1-like [Cornus florida]